MPFVSEAQRRKFHADPKLRRYIPEFDAATPPGSLPERVRPPRVKGRRKIHKARHSALTAMLAAGGNHKR